MAGKHKASSGVVGGNVLAAGLAVLLLGGAGFAGYQMMSSDPAEGAITPTAPNDPTSGGADPEPSSAEPPESPDAPASEPSDDVSTGLPAGCREQLDAGTKAIAAADQSYRDWYGHTQADFDYRAGKNTWAKTKSIWADTKKRGGSDVAAFTKARAAYAKTAGSGCHSVDRADAGPEVTKCLDRFTRLDNAISAGGKVNTDWSRHVQMMKRKDHTDPAVYTKEWRSMVDGSTTNQSAYRTAKAAYDKAPACTA